MKNLFISFYQLIALSLFFLSLNTNLQAQQDRKGYIGINLGVAIPIGDFASDDTNNENASLANAGTALNLIDFGYKFSENFGISASLGGSAFPIGPSELEVTLAYAGFFIGPIISVPINDRLDFNIIPKIGTTSATITIGDTELTEESGLGLDLGISLQYDLGKKWSLSFNNAFSQANYRDDFKVTSINSTLGIAFRLR